MSCYAVLCCVVLYYSVLCCVALLCCVVSCSVVSCYVVPCCVVLCCSVLSCVAVCYKLLLCTEKLQMKRPLPDVVKPEVAAGSDFHTVYQFTLVRLLSRGQTHVLVAATLPAEIEDGGK